MDLACRPVVVLVRSPSFLWHRPKGSASKLFFNSGRVTHMKKAKKAAETVG